MLHTPLIDRCRPARCTRITIARHVLPILTIVMLETGRAPAANAAMGALKPVFVNYHGTLTLNSVYASQDKRSKQGKQELSDITTRQGFRESLTLGTLGYVYHPDLMIFDLSGTYGEDQSQSVNNDIHATSHGGFDGYDAEILLLRSKPYNLEIFSSKDKKFSTSERGYQADDITTETGAEFNFNKRIYKVKAKYTNNTRTNAGATNTVNDYDLFADYFKPTLGPLKDFTTTIMHRYQDSSNTSSGRNSGWGEMTQQSSLANHFGYRMFDFGTDVALSDSKLSDSTGGKHTFDLASLNETINIELPWDLTSRIILFSNKGNDNNIWPALVNESTNKNERFSFGLTQTLYDSLTSRFMLETNSQDSTRTEQREDADGNLITISPVPGESQNTSYRLESRYRKQLPYNSLFDGELSMSENQISRSGANPQASVSLRNSGETIEINDTLGAAVTVEILQNNPDKTDICKSALLNPRMQSPCWLPLIKDQDYTINPATLVITIEEISPNRLLELGVDDSLETGFKNSDPELPPYGPFPLRVTISPPPTDATSHTDSASCGLTLFEVLSSRYRHSVTTQKGSYGEEVLDPEITEDAIYLGLTLKPITANISRQWIGTRGDEIIDEARIAFDQTRKFLEIVTVSLKAEAHSGHELATDAEGNSAPSSEDGYSYLFDIGTPVPYIDAGLKVTNGYSYTRGTLARLMLTGDGLLVTAPDTGIGDRSIMRTSISLIKAFTIPWVKLVANSYARYLFETTKDDSTKERTRFHYGVSARRAWRLGATTFILKANYSNLNDVLDLSNSSSNSLVTRQEEDTTNTSIVLTIVRKLF